MLRTAIVSYLLKLLSLIINTFLLFTVPFFPGSLLFEAPYSLLFGRFAPYSEYTMLA